MSIELRKPNINAKDVVGQTAQIKSFLHELTNQLNWALNTLTGEVAQIVMEQTKNDAKDVMSAEEKLKTFNALKEMIIKSADIVEAYEQNMELDFESKFWAAAGVTYEDEHGDTQTVTCDQEYIQYLKNSIDIGSEGITQNFSNIQMIRQKLLDYMALNIDGYIRTGLLEELENNEGVYGVEVGQKTTLDGEVIFNKFARFTPDRLSFYDENGNEVGYYAGDKFYITKGEITDELILGKFLIDAKDGLRIYWYDT